MIFVDELKSGFDTIMHPDKGTKRGMKTGEAIGYYYKFSVIPVILYMIVSALTLSSLPSVLPSYLSFLSSGIGIVAVIVLAIVEFWIIVPIAILIGAWVLQLVGRLFKMFKSGYTNTLTAMMYGELPSVGLSWLSAIPVVGAIVGVIAFLWGLWVTITALSNQQGTSKLGALGVLVATAIIVGVIVFIIVLILGILFIPRPLV